MICGSRSAFVDARIHVVEDQSCVDVALRCCGYQSTDHITGLLLRMGDMPGALKMKTRNMTDEC